MSGLRRLMSGVGGAIIPWWLGEGAIPESTDYTIYDAWSAPDLATSYINLANPGTRNAAPGVAPAHTQFSGWQFNGTTTWLDIPIFPRGVETLIVMYEDAAISNRYLFGVFQASPTRQFSAMPLAAAASYYEYLSATGSPAGEIRGGALALSQNGFYNNFKNVLAPISWGGAAQMARSISLGAVNQGTKFNFFGGRVLRVAGYNINLSNAQLKAVFDSMYSIGISSLSSYSAQVLALNPTLYFPSNTKNGFSYLKDYSGSNSFASCREGNLPFTNGLSGQYGEAIGFPGGISNYVIPDKTASALITPNEYSFACWLYNTNTPAAQVRTSNLYTTGLAEYSALEIRNGNALKIFQRENGVDQNPDPSVSGALLVTNTWNHIVFYNSLSAGKIGIYLNGVKYDYTKTTAGFLNNVCANYYPQIGSELVGRMQHIAYFDHPLTQTEVNSLL